MLMLLMSWLAIILPLLLIFHWRRQLSPRWKNPQVKGPSRAGWFVTGWDTSPYIYAMDSDTCSHCSLGCQNLFWLGMKASDYAGLLNINTTHAKRSWGDRSYAIDTDARHHFSDFVIVSKEDVTKKNRYIQSPDTQIGEEKYIRLSFFLTIWRNLNNSEWALLWHRWLLDSTFNSNFILSELIFIAWHIGALVLGGSLEYSFGYKQTRQICTHTSNKEICTHSS